MKRSLSELMWVILSGFSSLVLAFSLAWVVLAQTQFLYGVWHDVGGIREGIAQYGPKNRFKHGFAETTREQRLELFAQINTAIHRHGDGLENIKYETSTSHGVQLLLREPEVVHLQDVANLIDVMFWVVVVNALLWLMLVAYALKKNRLWFGLKRQLLPMVAVAMAIILVLILFGPEAVFNQLHIWIFPDGHQWFFYYQESLMSTMMLAPVLFAWIGATWALLAAILFLFIIHALNRLQGHITLSERASC